MAIADAIAVVVTLGIQRQHDALRPHLVKLATGLSIAQWPIQAASALVLILAWAWLVLIRAVFGMSFT